MVRLSFVLARVPVIKFRKGGGGHPSGAAAAASGTQTSQRSSAPAQGQPAAAMSTQSINDFELPARYRRTPMSQEEIDHINGGGIKDESSPAPPTLQRPAPASAIIRLPRGVLMQSGQKHKQAINLNIIIQKTERHSDK